MRIKTLHYNPYDNQTREEAFGDEHCKAPSRKKKLPMKLRVIRVAIKLVPNATPAIHKCYKHTFDTACACVCSRHHNYNMHRVCQNRIYTPYMTVYTVISLPKYHIHTVYIWSWPTLNMHWYGLSSTRHLVA